jgi:hypothetical protein
MYATGEDIYQVIKDEIRAHALWTSAACKEEMKKS